MTSLRTVISSQGIDLSHGAVAICAIPGKGRGVRATRDLKPGEVVEIAPTIELDPDQSAQIEQTPVGPFYFEHPLEVERGIVILGLTSIVNHADTPNAVVEWMHGEETGWLSILRILTPVSTGEEITHRYQCPPWFNVV